MVNDINRQGGFTLIEVIVTLVIGSIMASMLVSFMGSGLIASVRSTHIAREGNELNAAMEKITADYRYLLLTDTDPLTTLKQNIRNNTPSNVPERATYGAFSVSFPDFSNANVTNDDVLMVTITPKDSTVAQSLTCVFSR